jgi:alanyl-tRNA synthetase
MKAAEIRQSFLDFFREKQHTIVPSSSLLPDAPNLLFTNAGMNQFVPYFLGEQKPPFRPPRATDTQKCIRAGGKHNDLEDVGFDSYHHTFFEMLGNWSFGDYFKKEAIAWAWELLVERWKFPSTRLYVTVYQPEPGDPGEFDEEAHRHWLYWFTQAGLDPVTHIIPGGRADNFWSMGETGPCGPCSEIHMDLTAAGDSNGKLVNKSDPLCIEIWNLVFIQFNANSDGAFSPLPATHVDTGMGFERVAAIVECSNGFKTFDRPISNYDTTVFRPIFDAIARLSGRTYRGSFPVSRAGLTGQERIDVAFRVVADHLRTLVFAISDGIVPGNSDRNYVMRRILRRAVMFGRELGLRSSGFLRQLTPAMIDNFGDIFAELRKNQTKVGEILDAEEALFNRTLDRGWRLFEEQLAAQSGPAFSPEAAFMLYDTYGFPIDLTEVLLRERGLTLDESRVAVLLEEQRARSRAAQEKTVVLLTDEALPTEFVGFRQEQAAAVVTVVQREEDHTLIGVDRSPFYAEMGGQVSDTGSLTLADGSVLPVQGVSRQGGTFFLHVPKTALIEPGTEVLLSIDQARRRAVEANHTATHLLHWALHEVVGPEVRQRGSYVGPDRLRFDFNSNPVSLDQVRAIEKLVNARVIADKPVSWVELPYDEVKARPEVMQFFGEKYGTEVRVVQVGGEPGRLNGYSMELCGGTHVGRTGQIGFFRIISEGAISAGVRRMEALTGLTAFDHVADQEAKQAARIRELNEQLLDIKKAVEKEKNQALQRAAVDFTDRIQEPRFVDVLPDASGDYLQTIANLLKTRQFTGAVVLFGKLPETVNVVAFVGIDLAKTLNAGRIVQELTGLLGGKGGGRSDIARGVGKNLAKLEDAVARARELIS